jgi:hypothetical protein
MQGSRLRVTELGVCEWVKLELSRVTCDPALACFKSGFVYSRLGLKALPIWDCSTSIAFMFIYVCRVSDTWSRVTTGYLGN